MRIVGVLLLILAGLNLLVAAVGFLQTNASVTLISYAIGALLYLGGRRLLDEANRDSYAAAA